MQGHESKYNAGDNDCRVLTLLKPIVPVRYLKVVTHQNAYQKLQGAVIVGYLIGYDPATAHVEMQKSLATIVTTIIN